MTVEALLLVVTTLLALVAIGAAVVAVRAVRQLKSLHLSQAHARSSLHPSETGPTNAGMSGTGEGTNAEIFVPAVREDSPDELAPRVLHGRVIVPPTQSQVVRTALGRPGVRLSILAHGVARALRAENRDRIIALMRREYRHRHSERLRAGRRAVRMARPTSAPSTDRLHDHLREPQPLSLTDRVIRS